MDLALAILCPKHNVSHSPMVECPECSKWKSGVNIYLTDDELSILKQILRKEGEEFTELQLNKPHKDVYVKIMQTKKKMKYRGGH